MLITDSEATISSLVITNDLSEVPRMSLWLQQALESAGATHEQVFRFDLCANEAVTNIISYAFKNPGPHEIQLHLSRCDNQTRLTIVDDGFPFNPLEKAPHREPISLEDAQIGGLGIDLIRHFVDDCSYERQSDKNVLKLTNTYIDA